MKLLHTSDWHLGRSLYGRKRYEEFSAFLDWLAETIAAEKVDVLLVAGDVFDTTTPSNRAQALYYRFLCTIANSCCQHVVIISGNHDSPSFLDAPKELLKELCVHVVGTVTDSPADEVIDLQVASLVPSTPETSQSSLFAENDSTCLRNQRNQHLLVCAVPYLRDKDIRTATPGETIDDKNAKLIEGLANHYADVVNVAETKRTELQGASETRPVIPIIAMGHLFTAGGQTIDGDGVRELYVGSLAHVGRDVFPAAIDYLALGHLHVPQAVGGVEHIRYSGSPIPMGFGEAKQKKSVVLVELDCNSPDTKPAIRLLAVPCFQQLVRIVGSVEEIVSVLQDLKESDSKAWLEIEYTGKDVVSNLRDTLDEMLLDTEMELLRVKNRRLFDRVIKSVISEETLDDLKPEDVFARCLESFDVPLEGRGELLSCYNEILTEMQEADTNAE